MIDIWSSIECRYGWAIDYHGNFELSSHIATISDNNVSYGKYRLCWSLRCSLSKCSIGLLEVLSAIIRLHFSSISRNSLWVKINPNLCMWLNNACFMLIWFCFFSMFFVEV